MTAEQEVRRAAAALVASFARNDLEAYFSCFSPDATFLFPTMATLLPSRAAYREEWAQWQREQDFHILDCSTSDTHVQVHGDTGVLTHRVRTTLRASGSTSVLDERETVVFHRQDDGQWLAVHEHLSPTPDSPPP